MKKPKAFDRYSYYRRAVQSPDVDCRFISDAFKELRGHRPRDLREDFCGTFALCCEWVKLGRQNRAYGVDLDQEPLDYGYAHYAPQLTMDQQSRVYATQGSVLSAKVPRAHVVVALNFSFYLFKSRLMLKRYFQRSLKAMRPDGLLIVDCFGGKVCQEANEEHTKKKGFIYYWDQVSYDPVTNGGLFHIHFKLNSEAKRREKVFTYDWRMWTIPEIRETMLEAGFRRTHVYWEGTTRAGHGDGKFKRVEEGEECDGWIAYVVGER